MSEENFADNKDGQKKYDGIVAVFLFTLLMLAMHQCVTQYYASHFNYSELLTGNIKDKIYHPFAIYGWLDDMPASRKAMALKVISISTVTLGFVAAVFYLFSKRAVRAKSDMHGTARFAEFKEVEKFGLLNQKIEDSVVVGTVENKGRLEILRYTGNSPVMCVMPTRSGKGVGIIIPTLLSNKDSVFVYDIKGENYDITHKWRSEFSQIIKFEPASEEPTAFYNPLNEIRLNTNKEVKDVQVIAETIVWNGQSKNNVKDPHWQNNGTSLLAGVLLYELYQNPKATLTDTYRVLCSKDFKTKILEEMGEFNHDFISSTAQGFSSVPEKEFGSILSTAKTTMQIYADPLVAKSVSKSSFKIMDFKSENRVSFYMVIKPNDIDRLSPLLRIIISQIMGFCTEDQDHKENRLLMMLDEFANMGAMNLVETATSYVAGYGIRMFFILQDMEQLYRLYTDKETFTGNTAIKIMSAPQNKKTAQWLSDLLGKKTVVHKNVSRSGGLFALWGSSYNESFHEVGRSLMTPDEVMRLNNLKKEIVDGKEKVTEAGDLIIMVSGEYPIKGRHYLFFHDKRLMKKIG